MKQEKRERGTVCKCPFCEAEIEAAVELPAFCQPCQIVIIACSNCGEAVREGAESCPHCGKPL